MGRGGLIQGCGVPERRPVAVVGVVGLKRRMDEVRGPLRNEVSEEEVRLEGKLVARVREVPARDVVVVLRPHRDCGTGHVLVPLELDVGDVIPVAVVHHDLVPRHSGRLVPRVDGQVESERDVVQLPITDSGGVQDPGVVQIVRRDRKVHERDTARRAVGQVAQAPCGDQGACLHGHVLRQRHGEQAVDAHQVEPVCCVLLLELDEPVQALRQDRVHRDPTGREVVSARVVNVGAPEEPLVLCENHDVIPMRTRPIDDAEHGIPRLHRDQVAATEPVRDDGPDDDRREVAAGARRACGSHQAEGDRKHDSHRQHRSQRPHTFSSFRGSKPHYVHSVAMYLRQS